MPTRSVRKQGRGKRRHPNRRYESTISNNLSHSFNCNASIILNNLCRYQKCLPLS